MLNIPPNAEELLDKSPLSGASCVFIKISDEWGIKAYYDDENIRDHCFNTQAEWSEYGFGPPVGETFRIGEYYCYSTRVAEVLIDPQADCYTWDKVEQKYKSLLWKRELEMEGEGFHVCDGHIANWGYYDGELVLIDFDHV